jgi:uncharacterized protein YndB with AHSA1/START domain
MGMMGGSAEMPEARGFVVSRDLNAARELVWSMWTVAEHVQRWFGPKGFTVPFCKTDFHVGGKYLLCMRGPDGKDIWNTGVYREIVPMLRIVCTASFADDKGEVVPASYYGMTEAFPLEMLWTITLEDLMGKTRLTVRHSGVNPGVDSENARRGWEESFDKLADALRK